MTKEYLGRRPRSQAEIDQRLKTLIANHVFKDVAFAACAVELSTAAVEELLFASFKVDANNLYGLEGYLQAVVVLAHCKNGYYSPKDGLFATALVPVVRDAVSSRVVRPATVNGLFSACTDGAPEDALLLSRTNLLTQRVCHLLDSTLAEFASRFQWQRAFEYHEGLSRLSIAAERFDTSLERCLDAHFATWRGWAEWTPSAFRLHVWSSIQSNNSAINEIKVFSNLAELDGPDLTIDGPISRCKWRRLNHEGKMLQWFQSKGFSLGPGLITGDSEELLNRFVPEFLDIASHALESGRISALLLLHFLKKDGLDSHTLSTWQSAMSLLAQPLPEFVSGIVDAEARSGNSFSIAVTHGLHVLSGEAARRIREALRTEVAECVEQATHILVQQFKSSLSRGEEWIAHAKQLWELREAISQSTWLQYSLDRPLLSACNLQVPINELQVLHDLHTMLRVLSERPEIYKIQSAVDGYVSAFVTGGSVHEYEMTSVPQALHVLWQRTSSAPVRRAAIQIAYLDTFGLTDRRSCIEELHSISDLLLENLQTSLANLRQSEPSECMKLARIVAILSSTRSIKPCWQALVKWALEEYEIRLDQRALTSLGFEAYQQCIMDLRGIVGDSIKELSRIQAWLSRLRPFSAVLQALERLPDSDETIHCILTSKRLPMCECYTRMLQFLQNETHVWRLQLMQNMILSSRDNVGQSALVCEAIHSISKVDMEGFKRCDGLVRTCQGSKYVGAARLVVWLRMPDLDPATETALSSLGQALRLGLDGDLSPPAACLKPAKTDYDDQVSRLVGITQELEASWKVLKMTDPDGLISTMEDLGIESPSGTAFLTADLPNHLLDVVEETADDKIDLHFPLNGLNVLGKHAYGLNGSETLLVHLRLDVSGRIDGFCVHLEEDVGNMDLVDHTYFEVDNSYAAPDRLFCHPRLNRLTYVVVRVLWRQLKARESTLERIYDGVRTTIHTAANRCLICGKDIGARLHRGTLCNSSQCVMTYSRSDLEVRLQDVRTDTRAVDLLLTAIYAAAETGNLTLLPEMPSLIGNAAEILVLLNSLPATVELKTAISLRTGLNRYGQRSEALAFWMLNSYRGFIVSASGQYRIPNLPNIHQFLLVDAAPATEAAFARHDALSPRHVLFHGTSIDRLYPILAQGLRVQSGTALQRHGAHYGHGIYLAQEPSVAMSYASGAGSNSSDVTFFNWRQEFQQARLLLGCEHAGKYTGLGGLTGVHVITDPSRVMVRYIFLVPPNAQMPRAQDISIPMLSAFNSLRSSAAPALS